MKHLIFFAVFLITVNAQAIDETAIQKSDFVDQKINLETPVKPSPTKSNYFYLPNNEQTSAKVSHTIRGREKVSFPVSGYYNEIDNTVETTFEEQSTSSTTLELTNAISSRGYLSTEIGFDSSSWSNKGQKEMTARGLRDLSFTYTRVNPYSESALIYGANLSISPKNNIAPSKLTEGNSFSGKNSLTPFIGFELQGAKTVSGAALYITVAETSYYADENGPEIYPGMMLESFYEFSLASFCELGFIIGLGHKEAGYFGNGRLDYNAVITDYGAETYLNFDVFQDTKIGVNLRADTLDLGTSETTVSTGFSFQKIL